MNKLLFLVTFLFVLLSVNNTSAQTQFDQIKYVGTIGNNPVVLKFIVPDHFYNYIQGYYYYTKYKKEIEFRGKDEVFQGEIKLTEKVNGKSTGYFIFNNLDGIDFPGKLNGKWYTMDRKKSFDVLLRKQ